MTYEADTRHRSKSTNTLSSAWISHPTDKLCKLPHSGPSWCESRCHCKSVQSCHYQTYEMSASTSDRFPYVDLDGKRTKKSQYSATDKTKFMPRTCVPAKPTSGVSEPVMACMVGQIAPGKAKSWAKYSSRPKDDNPAAHHKSFKSANLSVDSDWAWVAEPWLWSSWGLTGQPILPCLQSLRAL